MAERFGYRGYIGTRPLRGSHLPQAVQNLVIRDYAQRKGLAYKLSAVEWAMPGCYAMLDQVLAELPALEGIITYSIFMLPPAPKQRLAIYDNVLQSGATLYAALEDLQITQQTDIRRIEDLWLVQSCLDRTGA